MATTWMNRPNVTISTTSSSLGICIPPRWATAPKWQRFRSVSCCSSAPKDSVKIKVVGVGGGGNSALNHMIGNGLHGVDFHAINTDAQALLPFAAENTMKIGKDLTRGTSGNPLLGEKAADEAKEVIQRALEGSDIVFIVAGMGGGTGSGAAPVVAKISREAGYLTIGVVTYPFHFEGPKRSVLAMEAIEKMHKNVDTLIVINNNRLLSIAHEEIPFGKSFILVDQVLYQGVQAISNLITIPGTVNFADVKAVLKDTGTAVLGLGISSSNNRAVAAAQEAILLPLIGSSIKSATKVICNISGGKDLTLQEVNRLSQVVTSLADPAANIIFGAVLDERNTGEIHVVTVATGFSKSVQEKLLADWKEAPLRQGFISVLFDLFKL